MMNCTKTMAIVSAVYCHASPRKNISPMKMDKQNVLFIEAAPCKADNETVMVFLVFLAA